MLSRSILLLAPWLTAVLFGPSAPTVPERWEKMPIRPPEAARAGVAPGGEGGQWPRGGVVLSIREPDFLLLPIDVGGLYRSLDGGKNWQCSMAGWNARGANGFAIDPKNPRHVIGVAANSSDWGEGWGDNIPNGIYLSTDQAASWKQTHKLREGTGVAVAIDPASYDAAKGFCTVAYVASPIGGLLRTADGGATWTKVSERNREIHPDRFPIPLLRVHPTNGSVLLGGKTGLFRSDDGGRTFVRLREGEVWGLCLLPNAPDRLYVSGSDGILRSDDGGKSWTTLAAQGVDQQNGKPIRDLSVSPADPRRMTCWVSGDNWRWVRYVSHDGGASFVPIDIQKGFAPMPLNVREGWYTWHPTDPNLVYGLGGDWVTRSTDGGRTFTWHNNGYNGIMLGGLFNFSAFEPDTVFLAFQDYNGAFTTDGGKTWNYRDVSGKGWGGHCYGGFAVDRQVMFYGDAEEWGGPRTLRLSRDGGATWQFARDADTGKNAVLKGPDVGAADPRDRNVLFASNYRSADRGATWRAMPDCDGVFITVAGALYGKKEDRVVRSVDQGVTWKTVVTVPGGFTDLAVDPGRQRIYVASEERLKYWAGGDRWTSVPTPADQYGNTRVRTVAVDPVDPSVVYVGGSRDTYATTAAVCRSTDAGKTWTNLTVTAPLSTTQGDGPHEVNAIRVHPRTRYAWVNGQCYGMWKIAPPAGRR
ncbi:MAG: hypothetical protein SFU56_03285 [Capsulimonadales bacterium]|nr:hypothetical protein [Capsulimonadales bacterium]